MNPNCPPQIIGFTPARLITSGHQGGFAARTLRIIGLGALLLVASAGFALAAPFAKQVEFKQPAGNMITLWGEGDEFQAVFESLDGYTVTFDPATKTYFYAELSADGDNLVPTAMAVGNGDPQTLGLPKHLRRSAAAVKRDARTRFELWDQATKNGERWKALKAEHNAIEKATANGEPAPPTTTTTGNKVGLCLLIDFSDVPATIPQASISSFCNDDNYTGFGNNGSVKKYYQDNSNNKLTYTNVVTAYVRMAQPKSYYNDTSKDAGIQGRLLINDAITLLKKQPNYDAAFAPITVEGGVVVAFNVFYAGGDGGSWSRGLWPHSWSLKDPLLLTAGKSLLPYQITNIGGALELGTFCHENGHMLCGFDDIYDYDGGSRGGAGGFCLMDYGGHGTNPVQLCAYLKRAAGWATTIPFASAENITGSLSAAVGSSGFNTFYRCVKPGVPTEYYLIENRQKSGRDTNIAASGIAVWHIDELGDRDNQSMVPNTSHANYEVTLVQADNLWHFQRNGNSGDAQDLYYSSNPAAAYTNILNDTSYPNAHWWNGTNSGIRLSAFGSNGATMSFVNGVADPYDPTLFTATASVADFTRIDLTWQAGTSIGTGGYLVARSTTPTFGTPTGTYTVGGTIAGGGTVIYKGNATSCTDTGLTQGTTYYYKAWVIKTTSQTPPYSTGVNTSATTPSPLKVPFTEGFESGTMPVGWSQILVTSEKPGVTIDWTYQNGGNSGNPAAANGGSSNAVLWKDAAAGYTTKLVTQMIDFGTNTINPTLTFYHCMMKNGGYQDKLKVYYKTSAGGGWIELANYPNETPVWTKRTILLPGVNSTYYIAFEGTAQKGFGVCIDDVAVTGTTPPSSISTLDNLTLSDGTLNPTFASATKSYTASVNNDTAVISVPPTATNDKATIKVNAVTVATGETSAPIPLVIGPNTITIEVKSENLATTNTYTVIVTRMSNISTLSNLVVLGCSLSPTFTENTADYTASTTDDKVWVTPTATNAGATIMVNTFTVASGNNSPAIPLVMGPNTITTLVTSQDGLNSRTYTVTVTRGVAQSPLQNWRFQYFGNSENVGEGADDQDPDKDGATNLQEFAFNGNPNDPASTGQIYVLTADSSYDWDSNKELILTIAVRKSANFPLDASVPVTGDGITYIIEGGFTLSDFDKNNVWGVEQILTGVPDLTDPTNYKYCSFSLINSGGLNGKGFLRAKVTSP